jgi:hypothetical protein
MLSSFSSPWRFIYIIAVETPRICFFLVLLEVFFFFFATLFGMATMKQFQIQGESAAYCSKKNGRKKRMKTVSQRRPFHHRDPLFQKVIYHWLEGDEKRQYPALFPSSRFHVDGWSAR